MKKTFAKIDKTAGLTVPKKLLNKAKLRGDVEIVIAGDTVVIRPKGWNPRAGWAEQMKRAIEKHGPPEPMDPDWECMQNEFDKKEWTW